MCERRGSRNRVGPAPCASCVTREISTLPFSFPLDLVYVKLHLIDPITLCDGFLVDWKE